MSQDSMLTIYMDSYQTPNQVVMWSLSDLTEVGGGIQTMTTTKASVFVPGPLNGFSF